MPPLPNNVSIWYWPSRTVPTMELGSSSSTSPSTGQKLTLSSYLVLQTVQCFMRTKQSTFRTDRSRHESQVEISEAPGMCSLTYAPCEFQGWSESVLQKERPQNIEDKVGGEVSKHG